MEVSFCNSAARSDCSIPYHLIRTATFSANSIVKKRVTQIVSVLGRDVSAFRIHKSKSIKSPYLQAISYGTSVAQYRLRNGIVSGDQKAMAIQSRDCKRAHHRLKRKRAATRIIKMEIPVKGSMMLHGWIDETGQILADNPMVSHFVPIASRLELPTKTARPIAPNAPNSHGY